MSSDGSVRFLRESSKTVAYKGPGYKLWKAASEESAYYQTSEELEILREQSSLVAKRKKKGAVIMDQGAGGWRKAKVLLLEIDALGTECSYICVDISRDAIEEALRYLQPCLKHVKAQGITGSFNDGLERMQELDCAQYAILYLGSTMWLDNPPTSNERIQMLRKILRPDDFI